MKARTAVPQTKSSSSVTNGQCAASLLSPRAARPGALIAAFRGTVTGGAYAAVILSGGYEESGSFGRYRVRSGHVLLHRAFDAHVDRFESSGARILNLLLNEPPAFGLGVVADADTSARVAEKDLPAAVEALRETMASIEPQPAAQSALALITADGSSLAEIAAVAGFADQSHMTRAVRALTGRTPGDWLRSNRFKMRRMEHLHKEA